MPWRRVVIHSKVAATGPVCVCNWLKPGLSGRPLSTVRKPAVRSWGGQRRAESPRPVLQFISFVSRIAASGCKPNDRLLLKWVKKLSGERVCLFVLLPNLESMKNWHLQPHVFSIECSPSTGCLPDLVQMRLQPLTGKPLLNSLLSRRLHFPGLCWVTDSAG